VQIIFWQISKNSLTYAESYDRLNDELRRPMMPKMTEITLEGAADLLRCHPRTILRAIQGQHNVYWVDDPAFNHQMIALDTLAEAYDTTADILRAVIEGRDRLLKPNEAAEVIGVVPRTFRAMMARGYPYSPDTHHSNLSRRSRYGRVKNGRIVRYRFSKIYDVALAREVE
jgi:hypothetical protein